MDCGREWLDPAEHSARIGAALEEASRLLKRWPRSDLDGAAAVVAGCFAARGAHVSGESHRHFARMLVDPYWLFKHPIQAHREGWRIWPFGREPKDD